ncbi:MAG TPA: DNA gyrase inhibitor YacG [Steroidobacteraceae bacterium]|nr:DNA gyrase inhibitor YacG [Steroidobacteraceae bacterium]
MTAPRVNCPTCGRSLDWTPQATFRPFCSERCRLIDLGAWLSEQRAIPGEATDDLADGESPPEE